MKPVPITRISVGSILTVLGFAVATVIIACGAAEDTATQPTADSAPPPAAAPAAPPAAEAPSAPSTSQGSQPAANPTPSPTPFATVRPTFTPVPVESIIAKDTIILVTQEEPNQLGPWSEGCQGNVPSMVCEDVASDPITWIDSNTFQVVPLSGIEGWEQTAPDTWRFTVRQGVEFHNGEPMNAEALKLGMDIAGDPTHDGAASFHGPLHAVVVDEYTTDVICDDPCPILPRQAIFNNVQAPEWWASASEDEKTRITVGIGPYRVIEWRSGVEVELEAFENYKPNEAFDSQMPTIQHMFQVWRGEALVRAAMVGTGEADWAADIGFAEKDNVPKFASGTNNEVYIYVLDTIWHPELRKVKVREALNLATDCETLMAALYDGLQKCFGNISAVGTVGITPENSKGYPYDPERAKQLLAEAEYNSENEIIIFARANRVYRDVELNEAVVNYWRAVGVNARLQIVEPAKRSQIANSGCHRLPDPRLCHDAPPQPEYFGSSHAIETATSNETLDYARQAWARNGCYRRGSRICDGSPGGLQDQIEEAMATPIGDLRQQRFETIADIVHNNYHFHPFFEVVTVYGMAENLQWTPRYDPRTRVNTMKFTQ